MLEYLNSDERAMALAARDFARHRLLALDRECDRTEASICQALPDIADMGFLAMRLPEACGGLACSKMLYAAIIKEIAYASPSAAVTISVHNMVGELLLRFGCKRLLAEVLPTWGQADNHAAFALSEADAGSDPSASSTMAEQREGCWILNGSKMWITSSAAGRWFAILAQTKSVGDKSGLCMLLVDGLQNGFERIAIKGKLGIRASETFSLHLTNVRAPLDHLLGEPGSGLKLALVALDGGRIGVAAQACGITEACLHEMVSYARQRTQFGHPIARFQAIQQMVADSKVELEAAKVLIARACQATEQGGCFTHEVAKAKLFASEMGSRVADRAIQVHGGTGYVNDARVEQLYRDARVTRIYEGTSEIQRLVIARRLLGDPGQC